MRTLEGRSAIVTGAGSGIGRATAELFAEHGARVLVADLAGARAREVAAHIVAAGGDASSTTVDVADPESVQRMVEARLESAGRIDVLFNGAGILAFGSVVDTSIDAWNRVIAVNLTGTFLCSRAVLPHMIERGSGTIVNVSSSTGAHDANADTAAYVASKGGVTLLTRSMAIDHAAAGVRVNAIAPGPTDTPMLRDNLSPQAREAFAQTFPMRRLGDPVELAQVALFLAGDQSSFMTGSIVAADGGQSAGI